MSALAYINKHQASFSSVQLNSEPAVTSISVSARIEYIQRFSKQAVLVIDDDAAVYSQAASHFLANLSSSISKEKPQEETNVAFISASAKLNDIQIRCRIIEQLFANTLFDPEKSLGVSIIQLIKKQKESITILVEHAHALSLQLKFELCQLVELANKTHNKINVVLFGQEQAAQEVSANKNIFNNKLAIIDAQSGQLFALDHAKFRNENTTFINKFWKKLILATVVIITIIAFSWLLLIEHDTFTLAKLPFKPSVVVEKPVIKSNTSSEALLVTEKVSISANANDINGALLGNTILAVKTEDKPAQAQDILQALALDEAETKLALIPKEVKPIIANKESIKTESSKSLVSKKVPTLESKKLLVDLTTNYYLNQSSGYVIQFAAFKALDVLPRFVKDYPKIEYYSYQRNLNAQPFIVLTSVVFSDKVQAMQMMKSLPKAILKRGPWLKPISEIKHEINTFKR